MSDNFRVKYNKVPQMGDLGGKKAATRNPVEALRYE
jgi:hypothetical protein